MTIKKARVRDSGDESRKQWLKRNMALGGREGSAPARATASETNIADRRIYVKGPSGTLVGVARWADPMYAHLSYLS